MHLNYQKEPQNKMLADDSLLTMVKSGSRARIDKSIFIVRLYHRLKPIISICHLYTLNWRLIT